MGRDTSRVEEILQELRAEGRIRVFSQEEMAESLTQSMEEFNRDFLARERRAMEEADRIVLTS